jgi:DNA-binding transcriptional LysR family regulator
MRKAAERLNTVQPSISRSIAELEHALGVRLLDRGGHGIAPTEYGRVLLKCGVAVFDDLRQGIKSIEFLADPTAGEVRIGCIQFLATNFVPAVVDRFSRRYPRIIFHIVPAGMDTLHRELNERNIDVLIARKSGAFTDDQLDYEILYDDSYVVLAGAQNPWARQRRIELAKLVNEPWVLPTPDSAVGVAAREAFRACGLDYPRATVFADSAEPRMSFLMTGRFLTISPASTLKFPPRRRELKVLPVELPMARTSVGIITLKNRTLSPVAKLFIEHAREIAKPLAKGK